MNTAIELHDSKCLAVEADNHGRGFVLLDAYVHRTDGEPGAASGEGGVQRIRLKLDEMSIEGVLGDLPASIFEGSLTVGTSIQDNMVPFPAKYSEAVLLSLTLADDARMVVVSGVGLSIEPDGTFRFVEPFIFTGPRRPIG
jgi:hypothetical protein